MEDMQEVFGENHCHGQADRKQSMMSVKENFYLIYETKVG